MKQDIKIILNVIYDKNENQMNYIDIDNITPDKECKTFITAIEHLLKAYKELEEFKKQVTEIENTNFIKYKNFIPVSLVEETIEELNKQEQELQNSISDEEREEYSDANISYQLMDIEVKRSVLQELLEKRK